MSDTNKNEPVVTPSDESADTSASSLEDFFDSDMDDSTAPPADGGFEAVSDDVVSPEDDFEGVDDDPSDFGVDDSSDEEEEKPKDESVKDDDDEEPEAASDDTEPEVDEDTPDDVPEDADADDSPSDEKFTEFDAETLRDWKKMQDDPNTGPVFKKLRGKLKASIDELASVKANIENSEEVQELKAQITQYETLNEEAVELRRELAVVDYRKSAEFKDNVIRPMSALGSQAKSIEEANSIAPDKIIEALRHPNEKVQDQMIEQIVEDHDLSDRDKARLFTMADRFLSITEVDKQLSAEADTKMESLREKEVGREAAEKVAFDREISGRLKSQVKDIASSLSLFITDDGLMNEDYKTFEGEVKELRLTSLDDEAKAIASAALLPRILAENGRLQSELTKQTRALSRYGKSQPKAAPVKSAPKKRKTADTFMGSFFDD